MSNFWIDIENANGVKQGDGPISSATSWESISRMDRAGTFSFFLPVSDAKAAIIKPKMIAKCYARVQDNVIEIGAGMIDQIIISVDAQGFSTLSVSGDDLLKELTNRSVGSLELTDGNGGGVTTALAQIMSFAPSGWSLDTANGYSTTAGNVYAKFEGESVLSALIKITQQRGEHFRLGAGRKIIWLRKSLLNSGIRAIHGGDPTALDGNKDACIITGITEEQDTYDICSRVYPFGSGVGEARLSLASTNRAAPSGYTLNKDENYVRHNSAETIYGRIDRYLSWKNIAPVSNSDLDVQSAANMVFDATLEYMEKHKQPEKFYRLDVSKVDKLIRPGETIRVVLRKIIDGYDAFNIDQDLTILETRNRIDRGGIRTTGLQVATVDRYAETGDSMLVNSMMEGRVMESYPQLNAASYYETFYDAIDGSNALEFPLLLGKEVVNVNEVRLYFKLQPLESTVKSVAGNTTTTPSGGAATTPSGGGSTTPSGGGSTTPSGGGSTSGGGGGIQEHAITGSVFDVTPAGNHTHWVGSTEAYTGSGGAHGHKMNHTHTVTLSNHQHATPDHNHTTPNHQHATPDHSHSTPNHQHTFIPNVSMEYGIYRDSSANVPSLAEILVKINGTSATASASEIGSGWYEVDLTGLVSNTSTFRPLRTVNTLQISCAGGKRAHISGKVRVRTVIQAIAVL